jgi:hypothetical protein
MAGLGYRAFSSGEVLTAANLQGYAVDQSVMKFATSADRTTALPVPSEGMVTYLADDDRIEIYDGTAYKIVYLPPTTYVPTATAYTRTSGSLIYSVAGHTMTITGKITVSAVSGSMAFSLPSGFTINSALASGDQVGVGKMTVAGAFFTSTVEHLSSTTLRPFAINTAATYANVVATSATVPGTWNAGSSFTVAVTFPLA